MEPDRCAVSSFTFSDVISIYSFVFRRRSECLVFLFYDGRLIFGRLLITVSFIHLGICRKDTINTKKRDLETTYLLHLEVKDLYQL